MPWYTNFIDTKNPSIEELETKIQTIDHIEMVRSLLQQVAIELLKRGMQHDASKLEEPELNVFTENTKILSGLTYGSPEYTEQLKKMKPALDHHYSNNSHHPEHHKDGIDGMTLVDIVEMLFDWLASSKRHADGDVMKSIDINAKRFGMSDQLVNIFKNTIKDFV